MDDNKKLRPGDKGYKGGEFYGTAYIDGKAYNTHTVKDENGNIVYFGTSKKFLGLF